MIKWFWLSCCLCLCSILAGAQQMVTFDRQSGAFPIVAAGQATPIFFDSTDAGLVGIAARMLQQDVAAVTGHQPKIVGNLYKAGRQVIIAGTLTGSGLLQQLEQDGKLNTKGIRGKWEAYHIQLVHQPVKGVEQALVIAGSDRRGAAYGIFTLSRQMGVSPWYWWADVPVQKHAAVYVRKGIYTDAPGVKYRGIFINDEAPALSSWTQKQFGGFNHKLYEKVFELVLRLRGNYLWPAMWGNAFYDDDPVNIAIADNWGVVIGTSHHEPLMRAHDEWRRYGSGKWNYDSNAVKLQSFWRAGMERAYNEKIVTVGMRGDGDEPMSRETATALLERIVADQRKIIADATGRPASETPQLWALYKEVQDYYDKGMRVPDDVTLLLCDDNWGNIRRLPRMGEPARKGGYGIYYHFDYVGGPRNYKWLNTNNIARVWEQMHQAWEHGVKQIWIVNVGDIKPMELPSSFFLDFAWAPNQWNPSNLRSYYTRWAAEQFGTAYAEHIGGLMRRYAQYAARRKPELLDAQTYRFSTRTADNEWGRVCAEWNTLQTAAEKIQEQLPAHMRDAYFQLVLHPVAAMANLHRMYEAHAANAYYAKQNHSLANEAARKVQHYYGQDSLLTEGYHRIAGGKWKGMMSQTHIGYTYWQQPVANKMPSVQWVSGASNTLPAAEQTSRSAAALVPAGSKGNVFIERDGVVAIEAANWSRAGNTGKAKWAVIPDIGRTGSGVALFPVGTNALPAGSQPVLEYVFYTYDTGSIALQTLVSPTLNIYNNEGLRLAVSIDEEQPKVVHVNANDKDGRTWERWVAANIITLTTKHQVSRAGRHVLKLWGVDAGVVVQRMVLDMGGLVPTYLGPAETNLNNKP